MTAMQAPPNRQSPRVSPRIYAREVGSFGTCKARRFAHSCHVSPGRLGRTETLVGRGTTPPTREETHVPAPHRVYAKDYEVAFTAKQVAALQHEAALTGLTISDLVRAAVEVAFMGDERRRPR